MRIRLLSSISGLAAILVLATASVATAKGADTSKFTPLNKKLAEANYPGEPDPSKNFTGFWKEKCEDPFGLQIMPYGTDGKYSIIFCGPGGCGKQGEDGQNTFITKDRNYQVISENEIKIRRSDGWDTYYRCTKETNPVLKYK